MIFTRLAKSSVALAIPVALLFLFTVTAEAQVTVTARAQVSYKGSPKGRLQNGNSVLGQISPAYDVDTYTFRAIQGQGIQLRFADLNQLPLFVPQMKVYEPNGSLFAADWGYTVAGVDFVAPVSGVYTLVVMDNAVGAATGPYKIHYTLAPGANEHGALINGGSVFETISLGDLDSYTFNAIQGESIQLRVADLDELGLIPRMKVYEPNGSLFAADWGYTVAGVDFVAPVSGIYTLVVMDNNVGAETGPYKIDYTRVPGANEHGALINGGNVFETIDLGDLDSYTFAATQGDSILVQMTDLNGLGLIPQMKIYEPDGSPFAGVWGYTVADIGFVAPVSGVYTLVVMDNAVGAETGPYDIYYTRQ